jgi:hypothetical protein
MLRSKRPTRLGVIALCTLAMPALATPALAAPTVEEEALRAALDHRPGDAVTLLEHAGDPHLRWVAGRLALASGDLATAARLFTGDDLGSVWGRVDLAERRGDAVGAATLALAQMDSALAGTHRDALGRLLVGWAGERAATDPANAARFLLAAIGLAPSVAVRRDAEDALYRLPPGLSDGAPLRGARQRLVDEPGNIPARLRVAIAMQSNRTATSAAWLAQVVHAGPRDDAFAAGATLAAMPIPDPLVLAALAELGARFPTDEPVATLRLEHAVALAGRDEAAGTAALAALEGTPPRVDVLEARANVTTDPIARRALWLQVAGLEGASVRGDAARQEALAALIVAVESAPAGAARQTAATRALTEPDGAGTATLLYHAIPDGPERTAALWRQAERFPTGPWCDELADRLVAAGADADVSERYATTCPDSDGTAAGAVRSHAGGATTLVLTPRTGGLDVLASATRVLHVSQHHVDAEALFRATAGNPLDSALDAYLLEPDASWDVTVAAGLVTTTALAPRGGGDLVTLTVRAEDQRATALVVRDPLDVQILRRGDDVALAVLRQGLAAGGVDLLVQDDSGTIHSARTDASGVVLLHQLGSGLRVMARRGNALGFAVSSTGGDAEVPTTTWGIVPWARAFAPEGEIADVEVFGTRPAAPSTGAGPGSGGKGKGAPGRGTLGSAPGNGPARLLSRSASREVLEEVPLTFVDGVAHARLFVHGGGTVVVVDGDGEHASTFLHPTVATRPAVVIRWEPAAPRPGENVVATVVPVGPVGPGGLAADVTLHTPGGETTQSLVLGPDGARFPVDRSADDDTDAVSVSVRLRDGHTYGSAPMEAADPPPALGPVPAVVAAGAPLKLDAPAGTWVRARLDEAGLLRWGKAGDPLVLPMAGTWYVCAWADRCGAEVPVVVVPAGPVSAAGSGGEPVAPGPGGAIDASGRWTGAPVLTAVTAEGIRSARIVRTGDLLVAGDAAGTRQAWVAVAAEGVPPVPLRGAEAPDLAVAGTLARGASSTLTLGAGLPAGTRVWAFLRDATAAPSRSLRSVDVADLWDGPAGFPGDAWSPTVRWGEAIAAGLLAEEERVAEATKVERVDFGFGADAEVGGLGGLGSKGMGMGGGGGYGSSAGMGAGAMMLGGLDHAGMPGDPAAIGVLEGVAPGAYPFTVPAWVAEADLELVARTPDGRWASREVHLGVGGGAVEPLPDAPPFVAPDSWDGQVASLLPIARSLPTDARAHALAALAARGVPGAAPALAATWSLAPAGAEAALARFVHAAGIAAGTGAGDLEAIPDLRRAERAEAALAIAGSDPERAKATAARLVKEPDQEPWVRTRAGLALWVAGAAGGTSSATTDALAALSGDDPGVAAARAVVSGKPEERFAATWWTIAASDASEPSDRALAIHALSLLGGGRPVTRVKATDPATGPAVVVEPALAAWRGGAFVRGGFGKEGAADPGVTLAAVDTVPIGRAVPVRVTIPAAAIPTRLHCPDDATFRSTTAWITLPPAPERREATCTVHAVHEGAAPLAVTWFAPRGGTIAALHPATTTVRLEVVAARDSATTDVMSPREQLGLGLALGATGDPAGLALLESLLATVPLPPDALRDASGTVLLGRRLGPPPAAAVAAPAEAPPGGAAPARAPGEVPATPREPDPAALIAAFTAYREHVPDGVLDLDTAAALARAYAKTGDPAHALAATRVVMDARFKEELGAVSELQAGGLALTALKLLRELVDRYPEVPTVVSARYLDPSMLLLRAEGDGDRLGYTRSSLRHTAAAELAAFLVLHPDAPQAPEAASLLSDALHALGDASRERAIAGLLARRYRDGAAAWRLSLADARSHLAAGDAGGAFHILDALKPPDEGAAEVDLARGQALEALGRLDAARDAYARSGTSEAQERSAWLDRDAFTLPPTLVLQPGTPPVVQAHLRPGAEVTVTAIRVTLEAVLLRDGGALDAESIRVDGLRPAASRTFRVDATGDVPLPVLPDGAYVVTVSTGASSQRMVVVHTDAELVVDSRYGDGTLVHLLDSRGAPLPDAQLWLFDGSGSAGAARTDGRGAAFVPFGGGQLGVLARRGDRYALALPDGGYGGGYNAPAASPAAPAGYGDVLEKNNAAYDVLFQQDAKQRVGVDAL